MNLVENKTNLLEPKKQLSLYGYEGYFDLFVKLFKNNSLPNSILLSGPKGVGKATFAYHFINYLLSNDEKNKYLLDSFTINEKNKSYNSVLNNIHSNFFLIDKSNKDEIIKVEQIRNLIKFLNKSTYDKDLKIVFIDNTDYLNLNSANALLKSIEEPNKSTFFFILNNDQSRLPNTIVSRSLNFKFHFNYKEKKEIFLSLINQYNIQDDLPSYDKFLYFDTPGNLLNYSFLLKNNNLNISDSTLSCIIYFINQYKIKTSSEILSIIIKLIELFYRDLTLKNITNSSYYLFKKNKLLKLINNMKKFNLDKKNILTSINIILAGEK